MNNQVAAPNWRRRAVIAAVVAAIVLSPLAMFFLLFASW